MKVKTTYMSERSRNNWSEPKVVSVEDFLGGFHNHVLLLPNMNWP